MKTICVRKNHLVPIVEFHHDRWHGSVVANNLDEFDFGSYDEKSGEWVSIGYCCAPLFSTGNREYSLIVDAGCSPVLNAVTLRTANDEFIVKELVEPRNDLHVFRSGVKQLRMSDEARRMVIEDFSWLCTNPFWRDLAYFGRQETLLTITAKRRGKYCVVELESLLDWFEDFAAESISLGCSLELK